MSLEVWLVFEAVSPEEDSVEAAMNDLLGNLKDEDGVEIVSEEKDEIKQMENPHPNLDEGFSQVVELNVECDTLTDAVKIVINYGPTYVQIEGPEHFDLDLKDAQNSLQEVANTMQQYAQMGVGGVLVAKSDEDSS